MPVKFHIICQLFFQDLTVNRMYCQILVKIPNMNFTNLHPVGVALYYVDSQDQCNIHLSQMPCKRT